MNVASLRSHIGVVNQEPVLFGKSILENIALGNPDATRAEIEAAAKAANAYDFVTRLPAGFDTLVGARGTQVPYGPPMHTKTWRWGAAIPLPCPHFPHRASLLRW